MHFEASIEDAVDEIRASSLPGTRVFWMPVPGKGTTSITSPRNATADSISAVGDAAWDYSRLDVVGDL